MDPELFPVLPEDLSALSDEELEDLRNQYRVALAAVKAGTADTGELSAAQVLEAAKAAFADFKAVEAEIAANVAGREAFEAELDEIAAEMGVEAQASVETEPEASTDEGDTPADELSVEGAEEAAAESEEEPAGDGDEAAAAGADVTAAAVEPRLPRKPRRMRPRAVAGDETRVELLASTSIPRAGIRSGDSLAEKVDLGRALGEAWHLGQEHVVVASAEIPYPNERKMVAGDPEGNAAKIAALTDPSSLVREDEFLATGGVCAPFPALYDYPIAGVTRTPVWDSLASVQVDRGGLQIPTPLDHTSARGAITVMTQENDAEGGTFALKNCLHLDCPEWEPVPTEAIAACVTIGNFNARAWPEGVARFNDRVAVAFAEAIDTAALNFIDNGSTPLIDEAKYGAVASLLQSILKAASRYRSEHRMDPEATLRLWLPSWIPDALLADLAMSQFDRFKVRSDITRYFGAANVAVTYYIDTATGEGQVFTPASPGGNLLAEFPLSVVYYLAHEGAWIGLDGGRIDLGVTRSHDLNETNDFAIFYEVFRSAALVGVESVKVTAELCVSGEVAIADDNVLVCGT